MEGKKPHVRWIIKRGGGIEGHFIQYVPPGHRNKMVRLDPRCFAFAPRKNEVTEVEIINDTHPDDPFEGTIFVHPLFPQPSMALSRELFINECVERLAASLIGTNNAFLEVDIPGWRGAIIYRVRNVNGPLQIDWVYHSADGRERTVLPFTRCFSQAVIRDGWVNRIVDWRQALVDLGRPFEISNELRDRLLVRWPGITAEISEEVAVQGGAILENIRREGRCIRADLILLEHRWTRSVELGRGEYIEGATVRRASINQAIFSGLNEREQALVVQLLQDTRHSLGWHQATALSHLVEERIPGIIWCEIDEVTKMVKGFEPRRYIQDSLHRLEERRQEIERLRLAIFVFAGDADSRIYEASLPEERTLAGLQRRNNDEIEEIDHYLTDLREQMRQLPARRKTDAFRKLLSAEIDKVAAEAKATKKGDPRLIQAVNHWAVQGTVYLARGSVEDALNCLHEAKELLFRLQYP